MNVDYPLVSIICITYNHEEYIGNALEGFVKQKTNFRFEVIVHDDASNDNTAEIIRKYEHEYPEIIKPIYQTENQYSKGVRIGKDILYPLARGKYIALCEGDDYWCDVCKLQKQIDYMESHPECGVTVHNTEYYNLLTQKKNVQFSTLSKRLYLNDCVKYGGQSFHTSSIVARKELVINRPAFTTMIKGVGDYPNAIYYAMCGNIFYFGDVMSVYRYGTSESWQKRVGRNRKKQIEIKEETIEMLKCADEYSKGEFHSEISEAMANHEYELLLLKQDYKNAILYNQFKNENIKKRMLYRLFAMCPMLIRLRNYISEG